MKKRASILSPIFSAARRERKGDLRVYERYKNRISQLPLNPKGYDASIKILSRILCV
jgi:hypothetical protein